MSCYWSLARWWTNGGRARAVKRNALQVPQQGSHPVDNRNKWNFSLLLEGIHHSKAGGRGVQGSHWRAVPSSPQTRASHGTRMLAPEELAKEYGGREWKYFMSDTGMAFRSGMSHVDSTATPSPCILDPEPATWGSEHDVQGSHCGFIEMGCIFLPNLSDFSLAVGSMLIKVFLILLF